MSPIPVPDLTTAKVAELLGMTPRKVTKTAREKGIGYDYGGRVGFRFTEGDVDRLLESLRVEAQPSQDGNAA